MTLRKKTLLITGITLLGLIAASYVISSSILLRGFGHLELQSVRRNLLRAVAGMDERIAELSRTASDWAAWDDMYAFAADGNSDFIKTNLLDNVFLQLQLNLIAVVQTSGELVYIRAFDLERKVEANPPQGLLGALAVGDRMLRQENLTSGRSGLMVLPEGLLMVASHPVLTSEEQGPSRGFLILARRLDAKQIEAIQEKAHLKFSIFPLSDAQSLPADVLLARDRLSETDPIFVRPLSADAIAAYSSLRDIDGNPSLIIRADSPRDIHREGQKSLGYLMVSLLLAGLAFGVIMLLFLEKLVLSRLMRLTEEVGEIGVSGDPAGRVSVQSQDEISRVAENINKTLGILENYQKGLQEVLSRFEAVIGRASFVAIQCFNRDGTILYWNETSAQLFGIAAKDALGKRMPDVISDRDGARRLEASLRQAFDTMQAVEPWEWAVRVAGGDSKTLLGSLFPVPDSDKVNEVFAMEVDITDRKRAEERVEATNRELEKVNEQLKEAMERANHLALEAQSANVAKSEFLARMSHEIRTPMNAVVGFADMLFDTTLTDEQVDYAETIRRNCEALLSLINDILNFSKIEAGQISLEQTEFDPEAIAYDVCETIFPRVKHNNVEILCRIGDEMPALIIGDPVRCRQILLNLLGNAAKFTDSGEIELAMEVDQQRENRVRLHVTVRDTGIGIPADKREVIFELFQQVDCRTAQRYEGTGLGLAICRQLARLMDGDVWVEPGATAGSVFHFVGWFGEARARMAQQRTRDSLMGKKALVVDDNEANLDILRNCLEVSGMRCLTLTDGAATIPSIARHAELNDPFDLCLLDLQMPTVSGCQIAQSIRRMGAGGVELPLVALSSSAHAEAKRGRQDGFDVYLQKPVQRKKLLDVIERLLLKLGVDQSPQKDAPVTGDTLMKADKQSIRILLAEDNPASQKLAERILSKAGYSVELANNGREVVDVYLAAPHRFDLIFMDVQMPGMDGIQATQEIRAAGFAAVPIIAMTASVMDGDREKCLSEGMNDYLAKPIRRELVYEVIKKWLPSKEG